MQKRTCPKISPTQIRMGTKHELEHTTSHKVAKRIALDHLCETPDYYTRLNKMEKKAKQDKSISTRKSPSVSFKPDFSLSLTDLFQDVKKAK